MYRPWFAAGRVVDDFEISGHPIPEHPFRKKFLGSVICFSESEKMPDPRNMLGICACLNLDAMSVPEALVYSIGILEVPGVFLARRWLKS